MACPSPTTTIHVEHHQSCGTLLFSYPVHTPISIKNSLDRSNLLCKIWITMLILCVNNHPESSLCLPQTLITYYLVVVQFELLSTISYFQSKFMSIAFPSHISTCTIFIIVLKHILSIQKQILLTTIEIQRTICLVTIYVLHAQSFQSEV